jgi:hypothetical protein
MKMTGTVYNLLECSLRNVEHFTALWRVMESSVHKLLDQHLITPQEEGAEHRATFLDALKGLEAATKCMCQFNTENTIK